MSHQHPAHAIFLTHLCFDCDLRSVVEFPTWGFSVLKKFGILDYLGFLIFG
jgi:hypothetical protein